jgi:hypothetical protein
LKSNADYSVRKPANILKKGDFSSFFALNFVGSKTGDLEPNAICRAIDSLRNCIYGCAQEMGDRNFYFIYTGHDRVFDGLSESEIEISDGTT